MQDNMSVQDNDFIVRIRPMLTDEGIWSGEIDLAVITSPDNELQDDDYVGIMHFCKMVASAIPVMETNEDFRELVHNYVVEIVDSMQEEVVDKTLEVVNQEGNVVTVDFKTKGNA
jgi:hypothetical protein